MCTCVWVGWVGWWWWWGWWCGRCVLTMSFSMPPHGQAPDSGRPCPCGHDPHGRVPVHTALKIPTSAQQDDERTHPIGDALTGLKHPSLHNDGHVHDNLAKNCTCGTSTGYCTVWTERLPCMTMGMPTPLSMQKAPQSLLPNRDLWKLYGLALVD